MTNFKKYTTIKLSIEDRDVFIPLLKRFFKSTYNKRRKYTAKEIVRVFQGYNEKNGFIFSSKFTEARLRKLTNYMRVNAILPIIADGEGYYISYMVEDIDAEINSLNSRIEAIEQAKQGLESMRMKIIRKKETQELDDFGILWSD
jgi:hypothetical protein